MNLISKEIAQLLNAQKKEWDLAKKNFAGLEKVQVREFDFDGITMKVQFNPGRIISSAAKVDKKSIETRPCFLCQVNRPPEQRGVTCGDYSVLVNPFPIFPQHFTVPTFAHTPQRIKNRFVEMLELAKAMPGFTLFYNGPKCGASAPDHFHFQVGNCGFMPLEKELAKLKEKDGKVYTPAGNKMLAIKDGLRNFLVLESSNRKVVNKMFEQVYTAMAGIAPAEEEPMMNILCGFVDGNWQVLVFPRALHRPWQYLAEGELNILLSPASVDMGGVLITPLEKDFLKITKEDIANIFKQVLLSDDKFNELLSQLAY